MGGEAAGASVITGGRFSMVVTCATCDKPPLVAVTVKVPVVTESLLKTASGLMVPPPLTVQEKGGAGFMMAPNWSFATAVNACVASLAMNAEAGDTVIDVTTGLRVIFTVLTAPAYAESWIAASKV